MIFDTISVKARWERWCRWNCDLRVINAQKKSHFLSYRKHRHDAQITWPYAYCVTLGSHCKMANLSSEDETDTLPGRPTRIQPYQFEPIRQDFERVLEHVGFNYTIAKLHSLKCSLHKWVWCSTARKSAHLYKLNLLLPHSESIARELVHCYTWGRLWIVTLTVRGNTVGRHS